MSFAPGKGAGKFEFRGESALGTGTGSWYNLRPETPPTLDANPITPVDVSYAGHRHPADCGEALPVGIRLTQAGAVSFQTGIYRAASGGNTPTLITLLKSMGLNESVGSTDTTVAGSPAVDAIELTADEGAVGRATVIELQDVTGHETGTLYWPTLAAAYSASTITPGMDLPKVPVATDTATIMHTISALTSTSYEVSSTASLQFRLSTWGEHDDAAGDYAPIRTACALETLGDITIPDEMGGKFLLDLSFTGYQNDSNTNDMTADSFYDSGVPLIKTDDFRFCFGDASTAGGITYATRPAKNVVFNPGWTVMMINQHGSGSIGGVQKYFLQVVPPTVTFTAYFDGDVKTQILDELESIDVGTQQTPKYIAAIQPSRNLSQPSFGIWMPNCHLATEKPYSLNATGDVLEFTATYRGGLAGYNSQTDIDEGGGQPIYIGLGNEAS